MVFFTCLCSSSIPLPDNPYYSVWLWASNGPGNLLVTEPQGLKAETVHDAISQPTCSLECRCWSFAT